MKWYTLKNKEAVVASSPEEAAELLKDAEARTVARTEFDDGYISTVFLCVDHNFVYDGTTTPLLFETMIFGDVLDQYCERYSTWEEAELGHFKAIKLRKKAKAVQEKDPTCEKDELLEAVTQNKGDVLYIY